MGSNFLKSEWLIPPGLAKWQRSALADLRRRVPRARDVVWLLSSGTTGAGRVKTLGLSFEALMASAHAVNMHLGASAKDRWSVEIPLYHIGGYSIPIRAKQVGAKYVIGGKWDVRTFVKRLIKSRVTLTSLVPTQVFDLVNAEAKAPASLRAVVVGGGSLDPNLYRRGRELGWPLLPSYGLTECASQVATASLTSLARNEFPGLVPLSHVQVEIQMQSLIVRSHSMSRWTATMTEDGRYTCEMTAPDGWLKTEDLAEWKGAQLAGRPSELKILGRRDDVVKVYGVLVSLAQVESDIREVSRVQGFDLGVGFTILARPAEREGSHLIVVHEDLKIPVADLIKSYNAGVTGPYRIRDVVRVDKIPRTALGKVIKNQLL